MVSVVIPTRNRLHLLKRSLQSVYDQTYKNIEIIVVDDFSEEETPAFLKKEMEDKGIRFIRNEMPNGAGKARNLGIKEASGDVIAFLDDDDEWYSQKLQKQILPFEDMEVGMVYTGSKLIKVDHNMSYYSIPEVSGYIFNELLIENRIGTTSMVAIRAKLAKELLFDEAFPARQDYDLWLRVAKKSKIAGIKEPLTKIYDRGTLNRITSNIDNYIVAVKMLNEKYEKDILKLPASRQKERLAAQSFFLGSQALMAGQMTLCRKYYLKSLIQQPRLKYVGGFAASLFGREALFRLRKLKKVN